MTNGGGHSDGIEKANFNFGNPVSGLFHIIVDKLGVVHCDSRTGVQYFESSEAYIGFPVTIWYGPGILL